MTFVQLGALEYVTTHINRHCLTDQACLDILVCKILVAVSGGAMSGDAARSNAASGDANSGDAVVLHIVCLHRLPVHDQHLQAIPSKAKSTLAQH